MTQPANVFSHEKLSHSCIQNYDKDNSHIIPFNYQVQNRNKGITQIHVSKLNIVNTV